MTFSKASFASLALGLAAGVNAHMVISNPIPFDQTALTNAPLAADGSDFPCKFGGATGYTSTVTQMNNLKVGETSNLTFMGGATHGGGSCQISISTDAVPTKDSVWKAIYSIEGGCPASAPGNVGGDASYQGPLLNSFDFSLPKSVPNGKVTLAWSWLNKVGNREFYMNCAPVTVSGGSSNTDDFNKLPDMEIYNIAVGGTTCITPESADMQYQNPGSSTTKVGSGPFTTASCKAEKAGSGAAATPAAGGDSSASGAAASSPADPAPAAATTGTGNPGGVFAPGASSAPAESPAASSPAAESPAASSPAGGAPAASPAPPAASGSPSSTGSGSCQAGWQPCTTEGVSCLSATQMINCANGCGYVTDLSTTGTTCDASGGSVHMGYASTSGQKREVKNFARRMPLHARRAASRDI